MEEGRKEKKEGGTKGERKYRSVKSSQSFLNKAPMMPEAA